jgi:hypothetical protein
MNKKKKEGNPAVLSHLKGDDHQHGCLPGVREGFYYALLHVDK